MINKLPATVKIPADDSDSMIKQLYKIFIDNNAKINEIITVQNTIEFKVSGISLLCSIDGGKTWKTITLT